MSGRVFSLGVLLAAGWFLIDRYATRPVYANPSSVAAPVTNAPTHRRLRARSVNSDNHVSQMLHPGVDRDSAENVITVVVPVPELTDAETVAMFSEMITPGLDRSQLLDRLGNPVLEAAMVDRGALFQTYVYQPKSHGPVVLAYLKDGKVLESVRSRW